jgi:hypothetical protein
MHVLVIYDDGERGIVHGDTWLEVVRQISCTAISLTVIQDVDFKLPPLELGG